MTARPFLRALACAAVLTLAPGVAHAATIESTTSGNWADPGTWTGGVVPDTGDTATISAGHSVTLTGDVTVTALEVEGSATLSLAGSRLTSTGDASLLGDYYSTSWLSGGPLDVGGKLLVQNTAVSNAAITVTGTTEFSGPLPGDPEASSFWSNSTFTQNLGSVTLSGHKITGVLDPVLNDANLTVRGLNDFTNRQLTLTGWGGVYFEPTALSGVNGAPMLTVGSLVVSGMHQTTVDWSGITGPAGGDRINLIDAPGGDVTDLIYSSGGTTIFGGPLTGEALHVTYDGNPRPAADPLPSVSSSSSLPGHALEGDTITCDAGTWTPDGTKAYSWSSDGNPIMGASASTYVVTANELGTDVKCTVAVTAAGVTGTEDASNAVHVDIAPGNILDPEVSSANADPAKAALGDVLTCDEGLWSATTPTYTYAWQRDGHAIGGATARTYTVVSADKGTEITCSVVATEGLASSSPVPALGAVEISSGPSALVPPAATSTRTPSNRATTGDVLTCDPGQWSVQGTVTYAWKRDGTPVNGATAATYTVVGADLGTSLTCSVTMTFNGDSGTEDSAAVTAVATPANSVAPSITGAPLTGKTTPGVQLTCAPGTWSGSPTYAYTWKRGTTTVATTSTYTPVTADAGGTLTCEVVATTNSISSAAVASAGVAVFLVPANSAAPAVTGTPVAGKTRVGLAVTCAPGTWSEHPAFTYVWKRDGSAINGATAGTYTPVGADVGTSLSCSVTAAANGFSSAASDSTGVAVVATAANTTPPSITGAPVAGKTTLGVQLTCDPGTWTLTPALAYAWKRGSTTVGTATTYTPVAADGGHTLTCEVTGTANGVPSAAAAAPGVAVLPDPDNTAAPSITGSGIVGEALTCATGSWVGTPDLFVRWLRGDTVVASGSSVYNVVRADRNAELRCKVTATTLGVERTATSAPVTAKAGAAITITEQPEAKLPARSTRVSYTLAPDAQVTSCTLNGVAPASCASPIELSGLRGTTAYALVINLRNEYGEDESRTIAFETVPPPPVKLTETPRALVNRLQPLTLRYEVVDDASVACTLDGQPIQCSRTEALFYGPQALGKHVFEVLATLPSGEQATERWTFDVVVSGLLYYLPKAVSVAASSWATVPYFVDQYYPNYEIEAPFPYERISDGGKAAIRFKAPAKPGTYEVRANYRGWRDLFLGSMKVTVYDPSAATTTKQAGGVIDGKSPLTCPKGSPDSFYSWYVNDKLVRTDQSNEFPAASVPKNGIVSCAVNDPERGFTPPVKVLVSDGVRLAASVAPSGEVSFAASAGTEVAVELQGKAKPATASKAKPKAARYTTLKTVKKKLRRGWTRVSLGRKVPKTGYKITIKIKRGKRYSKPLVLSRS